MPRWKPGHGRPDGLGPRRCDSWPLTGRCSVRDGGAASAVASVPRPGPTSECCMQDNEDGVGSVAAPAAPFGGDGAASAGKEPAFGAPRATPPRLWASRCVHVNGVLPCGGLPCAVLPGVGGFLRNGTLCGGACFATPRGRGGHAVPHNGPPAGVRAFRICAIGPLPVTDVAPLWPPPLSLRFNFREACRRCSAPAAAPRAWSRNTRPTGCSCDRG